jgi:hydrogenase maturation protease
MSAPRLLVVGVGNVLRGDDAFGIEVANRLMARDDLPQGVTVIETGIGGISLVQELMDGYDALLVLDAVDRGLEPGALILLEAEVPDVNDLSPIERQDFLADIHFANPHRALMLARAVGALPGVVHILGCQSGAHDDFVMEMSEVVRDALPEAIRRAVAWVRRPPLVSAPS